MARKIFLVIMAVLLNSGAMCYAEEQNVIQLSQPQFGAGYGAGCKERHGEAGVCEKRPGGAGVCS